MRPTFMGFETATRGLMVNQKSLDIVGNNVSNIGVTGYTRQRTDLVSLNVNMRYTRYNQNSVPFAGQGANVYGVSQIRDKFLDKRFREEYADVGYYSVTSGVIEDLAAAIDEVTPSTMSTAISKFQDTWGEMLSKNITESTGAANLLAQATQIVQVFRQMSAKIDNVWGQQQYSMSLEVENINSILSRIAQLNDTISQERFNSMTVGNENYRPLELLDQRNVLLDQLSQYADISYEEQSDGQVTVWMGAKSDTNPPAVQGDAYQQLQLQVNDSDPQFKTVSVFWAASGQDVNFASGSIRGNLDMLNGRGLGASSGRNESFTQGILYYKDKIDQFAKTFADAFNSVVELADPATNLAYDPPRYKTLFVFENDAYENAAGITINGDWEKDSTYLITNLVNKLDGGGDTNNTYAARAANVFENILDFGEFQGTIYDYITFYSVTKLGNDGDYANSRLDAVSSISDDLLNQIQQVSGVSMEEEGVDMLQYQKAYDAVARVFTTLDEMLDKLINGTGLVGR
ncbi:MAG: flagellar hook-associated protein FlgK [Ruminococcaceae bacterium]|nr:flagellar hook-associated protein FlgK [Oscillospiraceae bacterium]